MSAKSFLQGQWAIENPGGGLEIYTGPQPVQMSQSDGTARELVAGDNGFGADVLHFSGGKGVKTHTHEGDHILFVTAGKGKVIYNGQAHDLKPGMAYLIPGSVPHAIEAETDLAIIAVGNNREPPGSEKRLTIVDLPTQENNG